MSSGFGVSYFIALSSLAARVHTTYKDTIHDNGYISDEVAALRVLIDKAALHFKSTSLGSDGHPYAQNALTNCQSVLKDLDSFPRKYKSLPSATKRQVIFSKREIVALRESLISNTILLNGFVRGCEYRDIQIHLTFILGLHHLGSRISVTSIASFATNTNTEAAYNQFCEDLRQIGVTENVMCLKKNEILDAFKSQRMIASSKIGGSDMEDKDKVLETAYQEYCEGLYRIGFTDNMVLQQKDEILGILRSRGMVTSSTNRIEDKDNSPSSTKDMPSFRLSSRVKWFQSAGATPLDISASHCHTGTVELPFAKGPSTNKDNTSLLHVAAQNGYTQLAELLLGSTPSKDGIDIMELLFLKGTSIDAIHEDRYTPLQLAAIQGHIGIVDLLLSKGASIGAIGSTDGYTPLHLAAEVGHNGIVKLLLEKGATVGAKCMDSYTPLHYAACNGHSGVVELLLYKGASMNTKSCREYTPLHDAVSNGHIDTVKLLLVRGASIGAIVENGSTALHLAAEEGHTGIVKLLLERGARIEATSMNSYTPLHFAASRGHSEAVELLLEKGARIEAKSMNSYTPLHLAARNGYSGAVELLLEKGASIEAKNKSRKTPLDLAKEEKHTDIIRLLENKAVELRRPRAWASIFSSKEKREKIGHH